MLNITKTGCWQCQQQITLSNIEKGERGSYQSGDQRQANVTLSLESLLSA